MRREFAFTLDTSSIKFGPGVTKEVGSDVAELGASRVMVLTDPNLSQSDAVEITLKSLRDEGIDSVLYDQVRVEPSDSSFKEAIAVATNGGFEGFIAVGGGSTIDTAKAANLYSSYPSNFLDYVNPPIGEGRPVPGPLKPLVAVPTTAGTGSETTGVAIFDFEEIKAKTGIAHRYLRPSKGIIDPNNTKSLPRMVAASCGLDVLSHAIESLTALPYNDRPAPDDPKLRPAYQGANPISQIWASRAIEMVSKNLLRVIDDPSNDKARGEMLLASTFAGIGFGNAGVHLPHGMSYPIAGLVKDYVPNGYVVDHPIVPHGISVILNAPAVFRFTAPANPEAHLLAAHLLGVDTSDFSPSDAGQALSGAIVTMMEKTGMPNGLEALGYNETDIDNLVAGTLPQHRVTKLSPRPATAEDLRELFRQSLRIL
ncbi:MAG: NAD-dependent methanol dehydrogenase [Candidatus Moanabacter tarae]|uniref:hydroxyacid-oxoacid transhydrogenase n=1 Tax=Candidatus Moanibacter tarae TaxID=2200854 RepID=A0A2Z4ACC3_9BACT|nr:MAG: NAD-dependent methanol dehydrogenase [Candidatus Moanabacter tarae]|tara:strand:- start:8344 stop:9621 length:1278 start_codon:yes stop_codon:yes gene_type:complete